MLGFLRIPSRSQPRPPTSGIAQALARDGLPPGMEPSTLAVVLRRGSYASRPVNYFRVFDPIRIAERGLHIRTFGDLDDLPDLVVGSGHVEVDGAVVLSVRDPSPLTHTTAERR